MKPPAEVLAKTYLKNLYAAAFSVCRNVQDAEDVVQDTLVAYMTCNRDFQSEEHLRAWLLRVAINKAKNKRRSLFRTVPLEEYVETLSFETEEASEVFGAVMNLPKSYRIVIHLYYYEDYSVKEIAGILKLRPEAVKTRLSRGRAVLRTQLKEVWEDDES